MQPLCGLWAISRLPAKRLPWLGHRRAASDHTIPRRKHRALWPRQRPVSSAESERQPTRLYALSDLVLDLDSEDCKNVRNFDPSIDGMPEKTHQTRLREQTLVRRRAARFELDHERDERICEALRKDHFSPWHITSLDILSSMLEGTGPPKHDPAPKKLRHLHPYELLEAIYNENGIPRLAQDTASKAVPYMLHRQKFVGSQNLVTAKLADLKAALASFNDLWEVQRFFMRLTKTHGGWLLASQLSRRLGQILRRQAIRAKPQEAADILAFTNNVSYTLASMGLAAAPNFTGLGLALAIKCAAFPAARMYLENGSKSGHWDNPDIQPHLNASLSELLWLLSSQHRYTNDSSLVPQQQIQAARLAAYGLLTGYHVGGQLTAHCYRSTFSGREYQGLPHYKHYLDILGELGAFRTVWHEFQAGMRAQNGVNHPLQPCAVSVQSWFYSAILRAVRNVHSGRVRLEGTSLTEASGDYATDCELDLRTLMLSSESTTPPRDDCSANTESGDRLDATQHHMLTGLYRFEAQPKDEALEASVQDFLRQPNIQQAMTSLRRILFHSPPP